MIDDVSFICFLLISFPSRILNMLVNLGKYITKIPNEQWGELPYSLIDKDGKGGA